MARKALYRTWGLFLRIRLYSVLGWLFLRVRLYSVLGGREGGIDIFTSDAMQCGSPSAVCYGRIRRLSAQLEKRTLLRKSAAGRWCHFRWNMDEISLPFPCHFPAISLPFPSLDRVTDSALQRPLELIYRFVIRDQ